MAKRAALEKQRAAQGLGPEGQAAERTLQATAAEIEANKRCVMASCPCYKFGLNCLSYYA